MHKLLILFLFLIAFSFGNCLAQGLYTAKGYFEESNKTAYQSIKQKQIKGDSLTEEEMTYLSDFELYLANYFQRLPEEEKQKYEATKDQLSREQADKNSQTMADIRQNTYQWRNRDRFNSAFYGIYYGVAFGSIIGLDGTATSGLALVSGGLMLLGPAINPKRYIGISRTTMEAQSKGRFLGLCYGAGLGLALAGTGSETATLNTILGLSSVGSIILGEVGFQYQKRKKIGAGEIALMGHYGTLIPVAGISLLAAGQSTNSSSYGLTIFGAGIGGVLIGRKVSKSYSFTGGDVDAIRSLAWISGAVGITTIASTLENSNDVSTGLILIPAAAAIAGTIFGQQQVKHARLTDQQGSTLILASSGAALVGLGVAVLSGFESSTVIIGLPTAMALLTHQLLLSKFKMKNLKIMSSLNKKDNFKFSVNINPENYLIAKKMGSAGNLNLLAPQVQNPVFNLRLTF